jgi:hypothetical protein
MHLKATGCTQSVVGISCSTSGRGDSDRKVRARRWNALRQKRVVILVKGKDGFREVNCYSKLEQLELA